MSQTSLQRWILHAGTPALAAVALLNAPASAQTADVPTFTRDIAPILQQNCQVCHSPGSIAPMSLVSYEETRPWARAIKLRTETRQMPPWHVDKDVGIQSFKNDISLSDEEIATIAAWVDGGAPEGDPKDMPPPATFPSGAEWVLAEEFGEPDLVVQSTPYTVPAQGQDAWWRPEVETGVTEPRWIRAIEVLPAYPDGRKVTHHALVYLNQQEDPNIRTAGPTQGVGGLLTEFAIGKRGEVYPEGTGKLLMPGSKLGFEVHYSSMAGEEVPDDQVSVGIWFYPKGYTPTYRTQLSIFYVANNETLEIEPNSLATFQRSHVLQAPARIQSFQPHMHMRGKGMSMEALYPDGRRELLSMVSNFDWKWHNNYIFSDDAAPLLPKGTVLNFVAWLDNRETNPANPDYRQFITWGDRTVDEMAHAWVGITYLTQEDFEAQVEARKNARPATRETGE